MGKEEPPQICIEAGRHPVLDAIMDTPYVPNDTSLGNDKQGCHGTQIITGPNMGGKSSYIRQVALIAILAQVCCLLAYWLSLLSLQARYLRASYTVKPLWWTSGF